MHSDVPREHVNNNYLEKRSGLAFRISFSSQEPHNDGNGLSIAIEMNSYH